MTWECSPSIVTVHSAAIARARSLLAFCPLKPAGQRPDTRACRLALVRLSRFRERRCPILGADLGRRLPVAGASRLGRSQPAALAWDQGSVRAVREPGRERRWGAGGRT